MKLPTLTARWGWFAASTFLLLGLTLAHLEASPVAGQAVLFRYSFWTATAAATFLAWWLGQWLVIRGRERLTRRLLLASSLLATWLFVPASLWIDVVFSLPESEPFGLAMVVEEWLVSALPVFSGCMIASLPAWLATNGSPPSEGHLLHVQIAEPVTDPSAEASHAPLVESDGGLLPTAARGGVLRATAELQYVHLQSPEGMTTVPGPMHRVIGLLGDQGLEVRRGEWIADRHVKQVKSVAGRWVVLLKDGQQVAVGRRRLAEVKERWGSTRYA